MSDLPAVLRMQHNFNNEGLDQEAFDFIDSLVDVPLNELVYDLEVPSLPGSVLSPAHSSGTPAQGSQNNGNESHGQNKISVHEFGTNRSEHDRELGRRSQRRFRDRKKVHCMLHSRKAQATLRTAPTHTPAPLSLLSTSRSEVVEKEQLVPPRRSGRRSKQSWQTPKQL